MFEMCYMYVWRFEEIVAFLFFLFFLALLTGICGAFIPSSSALFIIIRIRAPGASTKNKSPLFLFLLYRVLLNVRSYVLFFESAASLFCLPPFSSIIHLTEWVTETRCIVRAFFEEWKKEGREIWSIRFKFDSHVAFLKVPFSGAKSVSILDSSLIRE